MGVYLGKKFILFIVFYFVWVYFKGKKAYLLKIPDYENKYQVFKELTNYET